MSNCLKLTNNIDVSNGKYIIENNYSSTSFDVYDNSNSNSNSSQVYYKFLNVPKEYPLGFYIDGCNNLTTNIYNGISSIIKYESDISENIKIYVSRGNDLSFNNGDYFRFYDESFNLLNISQTNISTNNFLLTASADNFYFMKGVSYEFIKAFDYSNNSPFGISGNFLNSPKEFTTSDNSFILYIDNSGTINNSTNKIYYYDLIKQDISGDLEFLIDSSGINYYYGNVKFNIMNSFLEDVSLSIKSYPKYNALLSDISNKSLFKYNNVCDYVIEGKNFQQNSLKNNNSECLTRISRADICLNDSKVFYEFNKETHNSLIRDKLDNGDLSLNNLKYGIYDGSYVIFDICENYPITISSEYITIEENYIYSKKYAKYSNLVQNLSGVNEIYKIHNYYYGAIQFTLNPDTPLINDFSFDLFILDKSNNNISIDSSNTLIYTDFCQGICGETNFLTNLNIKDFTFKLKNQETIIFNDASFSSIANQYKLNKYSEYIELPEPYVISDRFGHTNLENLFDISLVISSAPTDMSSTELISNNFDNSFVITYNFTYFDLSFVQRSRFVTIIDDVFIEFSESIQTKLFKNQSQFTDTIEISTNYFDESFNFFNDIEVYIKPNDSDIIYLPFEITITGNQLTQNVNLQSIPIQKNISIVSYDTNSLTSGDYKNINFNDLNYYLTDKILYEENTSDSNNFIDINATLKILFQIIDISNYSVQKNIFFNDISSIFYNFNDIRDGSGSEIILKGTNDDTGKNLINELIIYDISNNLQVNKKNSYTNKIYLHASNKDYPNDVDISFILTFNNENNIDKFEFEAIANKDLSQNINDIDFSYSSGDKFTISGEFFKNDFFKNNNHLIKQNNELNLLDLSFNGNYEFKIDVKGLETGDFIYNELSNNYGINRTGFNLSKIIYINVIDNVRPDLYFANPDKTKKGTINDFTIPYSVSFDILNGILFLNEKKANIEDYKDENPNKPIIVYNDKSTYDICLNTDISYTLFYQTNNIINNTTFIEISDNQDGSAIIVYNVKDLSDNISNDISLTIFFKNIPSLTICGEAVIDWDVNRNYYDQGLFINTNHFTGISYGVSINEPSSNFFNSYTLGTTNYDISFSTDFSSSKIGTYEISYNVNISGATDIATLRRTINVVDRKKPFVRLFDFSGTDFLTLDLSSISLDKLNTSVPENNIIRDSCYNDYKIDNSNNHIIDFSLTYLSSFHDLSRIIHAFDLCDNYTKVGTNTDDFSTNIILNISNIAIDFYNSDFDVKFTTNDLSYNDISYLNSDNSFIRVTQGAGNILPPLIFNYQIIDSCDNSFNFSRKVNIVDITKPTIDFSFIGLNNISYINDRIVEYDISKIDFSYQAFNYNKNQIEFLQEISNIIFNFQIIDNYNDNYTTENIQNNYNVTISSNNINNINHTFKNFNDFSNTIQNNQDINQYIINLFKDFSNNSFELIYDFSDNQYNSNFKKRTVNIINTIEPSINVIADSERINISFGDTSLNLNSFFNLSHPRLLNTDLSFELSYKLPEPRITSISNNDVSALIYQFQQDFSKVTFNNDISFFNIARKSNYPDLSSAIINPPININILPTNFQGFSTITHEAGIYLSDASLINGLTVTNEFDRFFYTYGEGSFNNISYTGSIFDICYIEKKSENNYYSVSFNEFQSDPSLIGEYRITYSLTNQNNYTEFKTRQLFIDDTIAPIFEITIPNSEDVNINNIYSEPGITFSDYGSRLNRLEYKIEKIQDSLTTEISNNTINDFSNQTTGSFKDITLLNIEDTSNSSISYTITYTIYDNSDLSSTISRTINVVNLNNIIIKPIIRYRFDTDSSYIDIVLDSDFSSNSPNNYDISFYYLHSSKTIFYEATTNSTFTQLIDFSYNYDLPTNVIKDNLQLFDPIYSIIPNKVNNYLIFFQIFNNETFENNIETINFNIIDTTKPKLTFEQNSEFTDICNIKLPLLSNSTYRNLTSNINYFNKLEEIYPSFTYKKDSNQNQIIFSIPGIIVDDIVDSNTITLSNESFDTNFKDVYDISVSYYNIEKYLSNINEVSINNNNFVLNNEKFVEKYKTTTSEKYKFKNIKKENPLGFYIDNCNNYQIKDYINYEPSSNIINIQVDYSNNINNFVFYDNSNTIISNSQLYFMTDVSYKFSTFNGSQYISVHHFGISGNMLSNIHDFSLINTDSSFEILIPNEANNDISTIFYSDLCNQEYDQKNLEILVTKENNNYIKYYYGDISFTILQDISKNSSISIKSYNNNIENKNLFNNDFSSNNIDYIYYIEPSNLLIHSGKYLQKYIIRDSNGNEADISRNINVVPFQPFIELSYNTDFSNNFYKKLYHKRYENYYDLDASGYDFSYNDMSYNIIDNNFNKNNLGIKTKTYIATNEDGLSGSKDLDIHIVDIDILKKDISLSSIIQDYSLNNPNNINSADYKRYGVYKNNTYNILTDGSSNSFRIINDQSDNNINTIFQDGFLDLSFSYLNNIVNVTSNKPTYIFDKHNYYYGNVSLEINNDFNRLSIEYLDTSGTTQITKTLKDIILYNEYFKTQNVNSGLSESIIERPVAENYFNEIIITVSNDTLYKTDFSINAFYLDHNNEPIEQRKTLYLPLGKYKFKQKNYTNFYNPIKFSYLPDGHFYDSSSATNKLNIDLCNIGLTSQNDVDFSFSSFNDPSYQKYEYVRGVEHFGLAGFNTSETGDNSNNGCTTLIIGPTTPSPLFYYCKNFPKMGGIIYVTSNLVLYKNIINLNGSILTKENQTTISYEKYEPRYNEISNNLVFLSQHFDISNNNTNIFSKKKHHIIGLTQQNINHNIIFLKDKTSKETNKLIFKKYEDASKNQSINSDFSYISNYKITEDNSANYLYDSSATQLKTDILMYDFHIDTSSNIINSDNSNSYDYDINKIFFNSNELFNYYYYFKKYNLLQEDLISTSFKYRLGEVAFFNPISIKNSEQEINFYDNLFFNNNRIVIEPLFQNKINLNLQVYIDPSTLTNPEQRLEYFNSEKDKYNLSYYQSIIDPSKILFQEYVINILSDISGKYPAIPATDDQSIIFSNGHIELNDYLLDSSYTNGFLEYIHAMDESNDLSLQDMVYLGFKDNDTSNNLFCGLTQQNIYHNMFIDDKYNIIFHPYRDNTNNNIYELNNIDNYKSRASNIQKLTNKKNYLIEVSSNDLYNTLTPFDNSDNIYSKTNVLNKNKYMNQNYDVDAEFKFKTRVSYKIYNELDNIDTKLNNLDIRPITLNGNNPDISNITDIYQSYPYAYDSALQETHSHSFKINLTDHIDRNFYKDRTNLETETGLTYQNIHYSKLYYVIKDISYNSDFNLYDSINNQNILYDKTKIKTLNYLQSLIYIINFKLDYFYEIKFEGKQTAFNFNPNDYKLIGFNSYQDLTRLISGDFIDTTYSLELPNVSLNQLFATVLYNSKIIVKKYNIFAEIFNYYDFNIEIIEIDNNIYNINNTLKNSIDQINQIDNDIKSIDIQLDNAYNNCLFIDLGVITDNSLNRYYILDQSSNTASILLNEFDTLLDLMIDFNKYKQEYNQINYELNLRGIINYEMLNNDFIDLYKFNDISGFYSALIDNMTKLNGLYLYDISNTFQDIKYITGKYWKVYDISLINNPEISFNNSGLNEQFFIDLSNSVTNNGGYDFSLDLYNISYGKYDLSLLKYFSNEISNNKIVDISNIEISYNNYYFYISGESYNIDTSKNFSYVKQDYYHDNSINTLNGDNDPSGIGFLKEDSYVLNFNRSIYNQSIDEAYDYLTKSFNFDTINYILNGQELVINSFQSNNIVIEFDVYYNSYLYPNKYLDTIVLDMFIPDLTPPTILFKTEVIDISQSSLDTDISSIAQLLINDISYIDINTNSDISIDDDISFAYTQVKETAMNYLDNNVDDSSYVNIYIDISQVANATINNNNNIYVYYTIYDNVNNMNIVKRRVNVVDLCLNPIEFYYYASTVKQYINVNGEDKFDLKIKKGEMLTYNLIRENIRAKDSENNSFINLNNITYTLAYQLVVDQIVTLQPNTYPNAITYKATGQYNNGTINRNIRVLEEDAIIIEPEPEKNTHCCYPAVYYKPIQHNYKLGSSNSTAMRMAKFIINS